MRKRREEICERYAHDIAYKLREQMRTIDEALMLEVDRKKVQADSLEKYTVAVISSESEFDGSNFSRIEDELVKKIASLKARLPEQKQKLSNLSEILRALTSQREYLAQIEL